MQRFLLEDYFSFIYKNDIKYIENWCKILEISINTLNIGVIPKNLAYPTLISLIKGELFTN